MGYDRNSDRPSALQFGENGQNKISGTGVTTPNGNVYGVFVSDADGTEIVATLDQGTENKGDATMTRTLDKGDMWEGVFLSATITGTAIGYLRGQ